jgi:hypothetical protein
VRLARPALLNWQGRLRALWQRRHARSQLRSRFPSGEGRTRAVPKLAADTSRPQPLRVAVATGTIAVTACRLRARSLRPAVFRPLRSNSWWTSQEVQLPGAVTYPSHDLPRSPAAANFDAAFRRLHPSRRLARNQIFAHPVEARHSEVRAQTRAAVICCTHTSLMSHK